MRSLLEEAFGSGKLREDEYLDPKTGLVTCVRCHGAREKVLQVEGRTFRPRCLCQCQRAAQERQEEERRRREFRDRVLRNRSLGLPEPALRQCTFERDEGFNPEMATAKKYVEKWKDMEAQAAGLLIWGEVGTGKTFLAGCIANALLEMGVTVLMTNFSRILNAMTGGYGVDRNAYVDDLNRYELLIIDDLGIERDTDFALEQVFSVIDSRYRVHRPLIVTTNLKPSQMRQTDSLARRRIYDRVLERCVPLQVNHRNIRADKAQQNLRCARELLK